MPMESRPEVSVILPTHNRASLLGRAIASVLSQTFRDFELIVVDDASTDGTGEIARSFEDARVKYLRNDSKRGAAAGENRGIEASRAELIAFIDDDDEWLDGKLEAQVSRFRIEPASIGVVYTGRWLNKHGTRQYGPPLSILSKKGEIHDELFTRRTFVPLVCAMVRKECFRVAGMFDESLPTSNDYDLWIRISRHFRFVYIPEPLVIVNYTPGSISTSPWNIIQARKILLEKHADEFRRIGRRLSAFFLWQIGTLMIASGEIKQGRLYLARAVARFPWNPGYILALMASLLGKEPYQRVKRLLHRMVSPA